MQETSETPNYIRNNNNFRYFIHIKGGSSLSLSLSHSLASNSQKRCEYFGIFIFFCWWRKWVFWLVLLWQALFSWVFYFFLLTPPPVPFTSRKCVHCPNFRSMFVYVLYFFFLWFLCVRRRNVLLSFLVSRLVQICYGTYQIEWKKNQRQISQVDQYKVQTVQLIVNSHCNHKQIQIVPLCLFLCKLLFLALFSFPSLSFRFVLLLHAIASIRAELKSSVHLFSLGDEWLWEKQKSREKKLKRHTRIADVHSVRVKV